MLVSSLKRILGQYGPADDYWYEDPPRVSSNYGLFLGRGGSMEQALRIDAVYACNALIGRTFGALSLKKFQRKPDGSKEELSHDGSSDYEVLRYQPNSWQTAFEHRLQQQTFFELRGNGYAFKVLGRAGNLLGLVPLHPDRVTPKLVEGELVYEYQPPQGEKKIFRREEIHHLRNLSLDGIVGLSTISTWGDVLAGYRVMQDYQLHFNRNDARPAMVMTVPQSVNKESVKELVKSIQEQQTGPNKGKTLIAQGVEKVESVTISNKDAQFLESRGFGINQVCRMFGTSPSKVFHYERAQGWSTWEYLGLEFQQDCILPRSVLREQAIRRDLLTLAERESGVFYEYDLNSLARASLQDRYAAYETAIRARVLLPNEARGFENLPPLEDGNEFPPIAGASPDTAPGRRRMPEPQRREEPPREEEDARLAVLAGTAAFSLVRSECAALRREISGFSEATEAGARESLCGKIEDYYASLPDKLQKYLKLDSGAARAYAQQHRAEALAAVREPDGALRALLAKWEKSAGHELAAAVLPKETVR